MDPQEKASLADAASPCTQEAVRDFNSRWA